MRALDTGAGELHSPRSGCESPPPLADHQPVKENVHEEVLGGTVVNHDGSSNFMIPWVVRPETAEGVGQLHLTKGGELPKSPTLVGATFDRILNLVLGFVDEGSECPSSDSGEELGHRQGETLEGTHNVARG